MEPTESEKNTSEMKKNESANNFDELYRIDTLTLSECPITASSNTLNAHFDPRKPLAGSTYPRALYYSTPKPPAHTFSDCDTSSFLLRTGPNYNKTGAKAAGGKSLYEVVGMDFVRCNSRIDDFASTVNIPEDWTNINTHVKGVPPLFVVNVQLPEDFSVSFFSTKSDGVGWSLVIFFRITQETADAMKNLSTAPPAVRLFADYCTHAPAALAAAGPNSTWAGRFKIILRCEDIEQFGLPSFITAYNSKPVLIRNTGTLIRGANYIEMDINVHKFASLPKRALESMFTRFDKMIFSAGFVVESRTDEEMPENMFGAAQINSPVHQMSPLWV